MQLLLVMTSYPFPPRVGSAIIAYNNIKELSKKHSVYFVCRDFNKKEDELFAKCVEKTEFIQPKNISKLFKLVKCVFYMMLGKLGQKMLNKAVYYKTEVPEEVLEFQAIASKHFNPVMEALPIFNDEQLKKIVSPIQFFGGEHDSLIDSVKTAERLMSLFPNANVHILKDTGHVIIDQFSAVKKFLNQTVL
jgi:hypothetical protein